MHKLDYLWLDGCTPTQIRYKTKVVKDFGNSVVGVPIWGLMEVQRNRPMVVVPIVF